MPAWCGRNLAANIVRFQLMGYLRHLCVAVSHAARRTHLKQTAERFAQLVGKVVLGVDRQVVLKNVDRVLAALVRCSSLGSLVAEKRHEPLVQGESVHVELLTRERHS